MRADNMKAAAEEKPRRFNEGEHVVCIGFHGSNAIYNGRLGIITKVITADT